MNEFGNVRTTANKIHNRNIFSRIVKIVFLLLLIIIAVLYFFLYIIYDNGKFIISLDKNLRDNKNVYLSEDGTLDGMVKSLSAESLEYMDNISMHWISENVDNEANGSHNGTNYLAYTFYVVNGGTQTVNYWYDIDIDDSIKNVDRAIRIMIYRNGEQKIYAKVNDVTKKEEEGTSKFYSDTIAVLEERKNFEPKSKDKFTIVIWLEGNDPDCVNDILGGEIKLHMDFTEEHIIKKK